MKMLLTMAAICFVCNVTAQHRLQKIWESDTTLAIPESVLPHPTKNLLYVSLINGGAWDKDGRGEIALLDTNGKILNAVWATGLHAPKGMAIVGNNLYVADVTDVIVIDVASGKVKTRIAIDSALMLNDVTANAAGTVYVSDSRTGKVYSITNNKPTLFLQGMQGVNGLRAHNNDLYVATSKQLLKASATGATTILADTEMGGDGIEPLSNGGWLLSSWSGTIYHIDAQGKSHRMLDTREQKINAADIGFAPASRVVYVPTFLKKSVVAYRLL